MWRVLASTSTAVARHGARTSTPLTSAKYVVIAIDPVRGATQRTELFDVTGEHVGQTAGAVGEDLVGLDHGDRPLRLQPPQPARTPQPRRGRPDDDDSLCFFMFLPRESSTRPSASALPRGCQARRLTLTYDARHLRQSFELGIDSTASTAKNPRPRRDAGWAGANSEFRIPNS